MKVDVRKSATVSHTDYRSCGKEREGGQTDVKCMKRKNTVRITPSLLNIER